MHKKIIKSLIVYIYILSFFFSEIVAAEEFENAMKAYNQSDFVKAFSLTQPIAENGNSAAQFLLGVMYTNGEGVTRDHKQAYIWYKKAAEQGRGAAQYNLGMMHIKGDGIPLNYNIAAEWFRKAAEQDISAAQFKLAHMFDVGNGVPQSYAEAIYWYTKAAEQGYLDAQFNLGALYQKNHSLQNLEQAVVYYKMASAQGDLQAQSNLGVMYAQGLGVEQDDLKAYMWWSLAANQSENGKAVENLTILVKKMTSSQIEAGRKLANKCLQNNYRECN
jgi:uncharacterized protein